MKTARRPEAKASPKDRALFEHIDEVLADYDRHRHEGVEQYLGRYADELATLHDRVAVARRTCAA